MNNTKDTNKRKLSSREEDPRADRLSEHQIRGWRAVSAGLQGKGSCKRSVLFVHAGSVVVVVVVVVDCIRCCCLLSCSGVGVGGSYSIDGLRSLFHKTLKFAIAPLVLTPFVPFRGV